MAIKRLNDASPSVKRPLRISDLADIWQGLNDLLSQDTLSTGPNGASGRILSGFVVKPDGKLGAGVLAYNGKLYMHPDTDGYRIPLGAAVYASETPSGDNRVFADGSTQPFSYLPLLSTNSSGTYLGTFTQANMDMWRFGGIPDGSLSLSKLHNTPFTSRIDVEYGNSTFSILGYYNVLGGASTAPTFSLTVNNSTNAEITANFAGKTVILTSVSGADTLQLDSQVDISPSTYPGAYVPNKIRIAQRYYKDSTNAAFVFPFPSAMSFRLIVSGWLV